MKHLRISILFLVLGLLAACTPTPQSNRDLKTQALDVILSEIRIDQPGTDNDEYFELQGPAGTSLEGFSYLVIGDGTGGSGVIEAIVDLSGEIPSNGYFVAAESSFSLGSADLITSLNFENSDNVTHLLVSGFTGSNGLDLDTDDDGTLDSEPWDALVDSVALVETAGSGEQVYSDTRVGPDGSFVPAHVYICNTGWQIGAFDPAGGDDTPSAVNPCGGTGGEAAKLVINEIDYDQPSTDAAEFVEIKNNDTEAVGLGAYSLALINGNGGSSYATFTLPSVTLEAGDYFVICANVATVPNCDLDVSPDTNLIQNGAPDAVALLFGDTLVDTVSYEGDVTDFVEGSGEGLVDSSSAPNLSISRFPDGSDTDQNNLDFSTRCATPGQGNSEANSDCPTPQAPVTFIHDVQGSGDSVAISSLVEVEAIVIGDYQRDDQLRGFFIQEEDSDVDADPNTSEGIFVFCGGCETDVSVGDLVTVTGLPEDFFGMSQLDVTEPGGSVALESSGNALPTPATVDLPASGSTEAETTFERVEGMLVTFTDTLVVSEYFELARYGQLVLSADARPRQFTDANEPSVSGYAAFLNTLERNRIILDDDNNIQNDATSVGPDEPYYWPRPGLSTTNFIRGGESISGLTGVMHWSFAGQRGTDAWRIRPVDVFDYTFNSENPRTAAPDEVGGSLKVASFNVLNYFTTIDARGADSQAELDRQRAKIAAAICTMDADIVGLVEIENNGSVALQDLLNGANGINANCGPYDFIDTSVIGTDQIAVAFIYKPASVFAVGDYTVLDSNVDSRFIDAKNRPALAQTFAEKATGGVTTVVVNHLKSKGSPCDDVGDPNLNDGQANCNETRRLAAEAMVDWLATDPTNSGDDDVLIIGDLNAYRNEDPIDAIEEGADDTLGTSDDYVDLLDALIGPSAYTYVFDGQLGYLDYALANQNLLAQVTGVTAWHINADEIPVFDYNDDIGDSGERSFERESSVLPIYEPNAYRSSDHDPVIVGHALSADADVLLNALENEVTALRADGTLNRGQTNALSRHLHNIRRSLDRGNTNAAQGQLSGLEDQISNFQADGILSDAQAEQLLCLTEALGNAIN